MPTPPLPDLPGDAADTRIPSLNELIQNRVDSPGEEEGGEPQQPQQRQQQQQQSKAVPIYAIVDQSNWLLHSLFTQRRYDECLALVEKQFKNVGGGEYCSFVKGLVKRQQGNLQESLDIFVLLSKKFPLNILTLKQIAKSRFLLGQYAEAKQDFIDTLKYAGRDWEINHNIGVCCLNMGSIKEAMDHFQTALSISRQESTYSHLARSHLLLGNTDESLIVYDEALQKAPDNVEFLVSYAILSLSKNQVATAGEYLQRALRNDPSNVDAVLAYASMLQSNQRQYDEAIIKYRVNAVKTPHSSQVWNNIGMCFFGKQKYVAAISCLQHALYLSPQNAGIHFNLGLCHIRTEQFANAFRHLNAAILLDETFGDAYLWLGVVLAKLNDVANAKGAFEKAIALAPKSPAAHLNYAVFLANTNDTFKAKALLQMTETLLAESPNTQNVAGNYHDMLQLLSQLQTSL